ncbi:MAG: TIM barrel protein [Armatimonadetes bacterium]|nr:TIM barrel protein [Armatimonadota bacterium]NIO76635.1 TIM barrel protein [Armatimonadota bacterium]NIO96444.1 TIM barrel protein [Armatimonadota bacterium]
MRFACQEVLTPGATLAEKAENLARWGYEGMELWGDNLKPRLDEIKKALSGPVKLSSICAGYRGCPLSADKNERDTALADTKELLSMGADLGGAGLIFVPIFGPPQLKDAGTSGDVISLEKDLLCELMDEAGAHAEKVGGTILLEPLNRYETHLLNRLEQAVEICKRVGNPRIKVMADFFHMNIEEPDIPTAIRAAGDHIAHVHLADSQRVQPGLGHTDFKSGFKALKEIGFDGYMALEVFPLQGDPNIELKKCADWMRTQM